jgi:hypothetical protein
MQELLNAIPGLTWNPAFKPLDSGFRLNQGGLLLCGVESL